MSCGETRSSTELVTLRADLYPGSKRYLVALARTMVQGEQARKEVAIVRCRQRELKNRCQEY